MAQKVAITRNQIKTPFKKDTLLDIFEASLLELVRFGRLINMLPFEANSTHQQIKSSKPRARIVWRFLVALYLLDVFYLIRAAPLVTLTKYGEEEFMNFYTHLISRLTAGIFAVVLLFAEQQCLQLINVLLKFRQKFEGKWAILFANIPQEITRTQKLSLAFGPTLAVILTHAQPIAPLIMHLQCRYSLRYWPALYLSRTLYDLTPIKALYALNDLLNSYLGIIVGMFQIVIIVGYLGLTHIWLIMICESIKRGMPVNLAIYIYKEQLVINRLANACIAEKIYPVAFPCGGLTLIYLIVNLLKGHRDTQSKIVYYGLGIATVLVIWSFRYMTDIGGHLCAISQSIKAELVQRCIRENRTQEIKRVKACSEVRMYYRNDFHFTEATFPALLGFIVDNSVTIMLATSI